MQVCSASSGCSGPGARVRSEVNIAERLTAPGPGWRVMRCSYWKCQDVGLVSALLIIVMQLRATIGAAGVAVRGCVTGSKLSVCNFQTASGGQTSDRVNNREPQPSLIEKVRVRVSALKVVPSSVAIEGPARPSCSSWHDGDGTGDTIETAGRPGGGR